MTLAAKETDCPLHSFLRLLMGPWTPHILWILSSQGPTRFGALKRSIPGISAKVLTERLRMLEEAAIIYRHYKPLVPPQVTYGLTERGKELRQVLASLNEIALRWDETDRSAIAKSA